MTFTKNIVLTGFMGAGKTSVSAELARLTGFSRLEVDEEIERTAGMTITEIFEKYGEPRFREMESEEVRRAAHKKSAIISTGGGAVMREENMGPLRESGLVVYLRARPETVLERTSRNSDRPLLQVEDPLKKINELLGMRKPYYELADLIVDTDDKSPREIAEEILDRMGWKRDA
jgi:shikimate kinase